MSKTVTYFLSFVIILFCSVVPAADSAKSNNAKSNSIKPDTAKIADAVAGRIERPLASFWGFDPDDSTAFLQAALDSGVRRLVIDRRSGPWIVCPLTVRGNQEIILEEGVELLAKSGAFHGLRDSLVTFPNSENVVMRGEGKGATLRMRKADYQSEAYAKAEWRNCIAIRGACNIVVENLLLAESGGDGVCVGNVTARDYPGQDYKRDIPSENITLRNIVCDANHRQGMSICSVRRILIENCVFRNTNGTAPQAGIDFEPDNALQRMTGCVLRNCLSENNSGAGYTYYLPNHAGCPDPFGIVMENCVSKGNRRHGLEIVFSASAKKKLPGTMTVKDCKFLNDRPGGIYIAEKTLGGASLAFENTTVHSWLEGTKEERAASEINAPIMLASRTTDELPPGEISFRDTTVRYHGAMPFMIYRDNSVNGFGLRNVTGTFNVAHNGAESRLTVDDAWCRTQYPAENVEGLHNCEALDYDYTPLANVPMPTGALANPLRIAAPIQWLLYVEKGQKVELTFAQFRFGREETREVVATVTTPEGTRARYTVKGSLTETTEISWTAKRSGICRIDVTRGNRILAIVKSNVPFGVSIYPSAHCVRTPGSYCFYVPEGTKRFGFKAVASDYSPVKMTLYNPAGKEVWSNDYINTNGVYYSPEDRNAESGVWSFKLERTKKRPHVSCNVALFGIPAMLYSTPEAVLLPKKKSAN